MKLAFARVEGKWGGGSMSRCITFSSKASFQHDTADLELFVLFSIRLRPSSSNTASLEPSSARRAASRVVTARPTARRRGRSYSYIKSGIRHTSLEDHLRSTIPTQTRRGRGSHARRRHRRRGVREMRSVPEGSGNGKGREGRSVVVSGSSGVEGIEEGGGASSRR